MKTQKSLFIISFLSLAFFFISCGKDGKIEEEIIDEEEVIQPSTKPNILLIIADDMGLDATPGYSVGTTKPIMPNLQKLIDQGIRFNNVWSNPTCSPTRAGMITGKYGFRTQVTQVGDELSTSEVTIQKYLKNKNTDYSSAVIGKWHLSKDPNHATNMGIEYYSGLLTGAVNSYFNWNYTSEGVTTKSTEYPTTKFTNLAIDWIDNQTKPWFLWLAYNAPHTPFHLPPSNLHTQNYLIDDQTSIDSNPTPYFMTMLEAMDTEIGRLLASMSKETIENTIIVFVGDNGTQGEVVQEYNSRRAKGTIYQGGVNVPMIVSGKGVTRINESDDALINTTDIFSTIAEIAGATSNLLPDSKSFKGLFTDKNAAVRTHIYSEIGNDAGSNSTIRNATHKYILFSDGSEALYDLSKNPFELPNLLSANQLPLSDNDSKMKAELLLKLAEIKQ